MVVAAALGIETLSTTRKAVGVLVAMAGVTVALGPGLGGAPAWRGDLVMAGGALLYNVWSHSFIARSRALTFTAAAMGVGATCLALVTWGQGVERSELLLVGVRAGRNNTGAGGRHNHGEPGDGGGARRRPAGGADRPERGGRRHSRRHRDLDCDRALTTTGRDR